MEDLDWSGLKGYMNPHKKNEYKDNKKPVKVISKKEISKAKSDGKKMSEQMKQEGAKQSRGGYKNDRSSVRGKGNETPYSYVPLSNVLKVENEIPKHNEISDNLYTGEIEYEITAVTPIFVADGTEDNNFYKNVDKKCAIPGSTMRGLIRNNVQILGLSSVHDDTDFYKNNKEKKDALDYAKSLFGYARENDSFKSRISFSGADLDDGGAKELRQVTLILQMPKAASSEKGVKQYLIQTSTKEETQKNNNQNILSTLKPLGKGTKFKGKVRFKNLTKAELGLLLWSMRLEKGCHMNVGKGKPYGYGNIELNILSVKLIDNKKAYSLDNPLNFDVKEDNTNYMEDFIKSYKDEVKLKLGGVDIAEEESIKKFFNVKKPVK
jgi:CRISPR/Cas system CSM-associated protein Csm3 (group 7 of RAMP superfamily)